MQEQNRLRVRSGGEVNYCLQGKRKVLCWVTVVRVQRQQLADIFSYMLAKAGPKQFLSTILSTIIFKEEVRLWRLLLWPHRREVPPDVCGGP